MDKSFRKGSRKGSDYARKGYKSKSHVLELQAQNQQGSLQRLQQESAYLQLKGTVLELLLEVASEIVVHKRKHIEVTFPDLNDQQLLEFLDEFLGKYGGYNALGATERNLFHLEEMKVDEYQSLTPDSFTERYTALVQRLSLMLLQASDDSMKGGLMSTVSDLKQLLIGALLWNPLVFHTVSAHHLVNGEAVVADPEHSEITMSGVGLDATHSEVLLIISAMYAAAVQKLECAHLALAAQLDGQLKQDVPDDLATVVDRISSNAFRLEATHQLYHSAVIQALLDQQLAHMCVRCFPRFPSFRDLLAALERINNKQPLGTPAAAAFVTADMSAGGSAKQAAAAVAAAVAAANGVSGAEAAAAGAGRGRGGLSCAAAAAAAAGSGGGGGAQTASTTSSDVEDPAAAAAAPSGGSLELSKSLQDPGQGSAMAAAAAADASRQAKSNGNFLQQQQQQQEEQLSCTRAAAAASCHPAASQRLAAIKVESDSAAAAAERSAVVAYSSSSKHSGVKRYASDLGHRCGFAAAHQHPPAKRGRPSNTSRQLSQQSPIHPAALPPTPVAAAAAGGLGAVTAATLAQIWDLDPAAAAALPVPLPEDVTARIRDSRVAEQQQQYGVGQVSQHLGSDHQLLAAAAATHNGAAATAISPVAAVAVNGDAMYHSSTAAAVIKQIMHTMQLPGTTPVQQQQLAGALQQLLLQERQQQQQPAVHSRGGVDGLLQSALGYNEDVLGWQQQQHGANDILAQLVHQVPTQQPQQQQASLLLATRQTANGEMSASPESLEGLLHKRQQQQQADQRPDQLLSKALGSLRNQTDVNDGSSSNSIAQTQQRLMVAVSDMLKAVSDVADASAAAEAASAGSSNAAMAAAEAALLAAAKAIQGLKARGAGSTAAAAAAVDRTALDPAVAAAMGNDDRALDLHHLREHDQHLLRQHTHQIDHKLVLKSLLGTALKQQQQHRLPGSTAWGALLSTVADQQADWGADSNSSSRLIMLQQQVQQQQQQEDSQDQQQHDQQQEEQHAQQLATAVDALKQLSQVRDDKQPHDKEPQKAAAAAAAGAAAWTGQHTDNCSTAAALASLRQQQQQSPTAKSSVYGLPAAAGSVPVAHKPTVLNGLNGRNGSSLLHLLGGAAAASHPATAVAAGGAGSSLCHKVHDRDSPSAGSSTTSAAQAAAAAAATGGAAAAHAGTDHVHTDCIQQQQQQLARLALLQQLQAGASQQQQQQQLERNLGLNNLSGDQLLSVMLSLLGGGTTSAAAAAAAAAAVADSSPLAAASAAPGINHQILADGLQQPHSGKDAGLASAVQGNINGAIRSHPGLSGLISLLARSNGAAAGAAAEPDGSAVDPPAAAAGHLRDFRSTMISRVIRTGSGGSNASSNGIDPAAAAADLARSDVGSALKNLGLSADLSDQGLNYRTAAGGAAPSNPLAALAYAAAAAANQQQHGPSSKLVNPEKD